eukprot:6434562-Lingulodinium_polyedra.AAC.2
MAPAAGGGVARPHLRVGRHGAAPGWRVGRVALAAHPAHVERAPAEERERAQLAARGVERGRRASSLCDGQRERHVVDDEEEPGAEELVRAQGVPGGQHKRAPFSAEDALGT